MTHFDAKAVDLVALIRSGGVRLTVCGRELVGACPIHMDRSNNLSVSPARNLWHCWVCGVGGSPIDWLIHTRQAVNAVEAIGILRGKDIVQVLRVMDAPKDEPLTQVDRALLNRVVMFYANTGLARASAYLKHRSIRPESVREPFRIGYSSGALLVAASTASVDVSYLQRIGLVTQQGIESFAGCLTIPILDVNGDAIGLYGRKVSAGKPTHLYLAGPHRGVWNGSAVTNSEPLIVCEAILDALTFWSQGFRNVTASYGASGWTKHHWKLLEEKRIKSVCLAYDSDTAGNAAATRLSFELESRGVKVKRIRFPVGKDANAYACAGGSLGKLVRGQYV